MENSTKQDLEDIKELLAKMEERIKVLEAQTITRKTWVITSDCFDHNDEDLYKSYNVPSTQATNKFEV